jgi:hypothetical protein
LDAFQSSTAGAVTIGQIEIRVENTTGQKISIYPDQGTIVAGSEQVKVELFLSAGDVGGDYFPGVIQEGRILFFLKRTPASAVESVLYAIRGPSLTDVFTRLGPDIEMRFTLQPK